MSKIISIHSFRGGTGKSNITANLAMLFAQDGQRVGVIDTDIQSPGIHVLFGLDGGDIKRSLNDFLWGRCAIADAAHDVTPTGDGTVAGRIHLIPSSIQTDEIVNVLREGYDISLLTNGFRNLIEALELDVLLIDTHPGLNEETLFSIAISHALAIVMRPDQQDYEGTGVTMEVARSLHVPRIVLVVNKMPPSFDAADVKKTFEETYNCGPAHVLLHSDEMMTLASRGLFVLEYRDHPVTEALRSLAKTLQG